METKKKLTRSNDRMIAGVCGGIAEYFELDSTLVRIGYMLISMLSVAFPGFLAYVVLMIIMPQVEE